MQLFFIARCMQDIFLFVYQHPDAPRFTHTLISAATLITLAFLRVQ